MRQIRYVLTGLLCAALFLAIALPVVGLAQTNAPPLAEAGQFLMTAERVSSTGAEAVFEFLGKQPILFLMVSLAIGYLVGAIKVGPIALGSTAGTLLTGVAISLTAQALFGITYAIPSILSSVFLLLFMYALGLKVGPQFFAGLKSGGAAFIVIGLVVWALNWLICMGGAQLFGLAPGFASGLISGSYTITAILGVAQSAVESGAYTMPEGLSGAEIGANMAAAYAISYICSSVGIILLIRYLPQLFGRDPVADAQAAEMAFSGGAMHAVPGAPGSLDLGLGSQSLRAFEVKADDLVGKSVGEIFKLHPEAPILRVVRGQQVLDAEKDPVVQMGDIVTARADIHDFLQEGVIIGPEVDNATALNIPIEAADIHVSNRAMDGKKLREVAQSAGFGVHLIAHFRGGNEIPAGPETELVRGDVIRLSGPDAAVRHAARVLGGVPVLASTFTEVKFMALAIAFGYVVGTLSVTLAGIPFALGTSAGCLLSGIFVSYFRSRNPEFGGPVDEGARSFLQDIGLNMFVAVLAANVGPKVAAALTGNTVFVLALIGTLAALLPPLVAYVIGTRFFGLNSVVCDGAVTGARNSTPGLNAIVEQSGSSVAAVPYPLTYALTTVLALIGGYISMVIS